MKKIFSLLMLAVMVLTAEGQPRGYSISGTLNGAEGIKLILQKSEAGKIVTISSAVVKDGKFTMEGAAIQFPETVLLITDDKKYRLTFYLENSDIKITGSLEYLANSTVTGSKTQDEARELSALIFPVSSKYVALTKEYEEAKKAGNETLAAEKMKLVMAQRDEIQKVQKNFILNHPNSFVILNLLRGMASNMSGNELESIINSLGEDVAKTQVIADLRSRVDILKRVDIGQKAPGFTQNDPSGKAVALSSLTGKNILLIDFWAGWCGPCRAENPNVVRVYNEFRDKGFDILGVSLDRTSSEWTEAITTDKLTWTQVSDIQYWNNSAAKLYGVNSIPANFLLDKNGIIIAKNLRGDALYDKVKELLGTK